LQFFIVDIGIILVYTCSFHLDFASGISYEGHGKFMDWQWCATVMQRDMVTILPHSSGGGNIVVT
jgi:hypothetical protein